MHHQLDTQTSRKTTSILMIIMIICGWVVARGFVGSYKSPLHQYIFLMRNAPRNLRVLEMVNDDSERIGSVVET